MRLRASEKFHRALCMGKAFLSLKIYSFRYQVKLLTDQEEYGIRDIFFFIWGKFMRTAAFK